jgi:hypothetical protein
MSAARTIALSFTRFRLGGRACLCFAVLLCGVLAYLANDPCRPVYSAPPYDLANLTSLMVGARDLQKYPVSHTTVSSRSSRFTAKCALGLAVQLPHCASRCSRTVVRLFLLAQAMLRLLWRLTVGAMVQSPNLRENLTLRVEKETTTPHPLPRALHPPCFCLSRTPNRLGDSPEWLGRCH